MTKKAPPKRETKKVVEHTLTSGKTTSKFRIELTKPQKEIVNFLRQNKVSLLTGESGTSKDTICFYRGLDAVMNKEYDKLIVVRPLVQSGVSLGFLKGLIRLTFNSSHVVGITKIVNGQLGIITCSLIGYQILSAVLNLA